MRNTDFYRVNFEKEIVVQGKTTLFLSVEATNLDDPIIWADRDALWVGPYVQPQTFESKFEGWTYIPQASMPDQPGAGIYRFYFRKEDFAKTGVFDLTGWDSIQVGDSVKAVSMWRRTLPGETPSSTNGPIDNIKFNAKVLAKGYESIALTAATVPLYYIDIDSNLAGSAQQPGREFLLQVGTWKTDDNWYINQVKASEVSAESLNSSTVTYITQVAGNQFDGQESVDGWPAATDFYPRSSTGVSNPWSAYTYYLGGAYTIPPRITFRIDYDGILDSHLKIGFVIAKGPESQAPSGWASALYALNPELLRTSVNYGQKLAQNDLVTTHLIDFEEAHLFGYAETSIRGDRTTYQNAYPLSGNEVYDDLSSFGVLKTNPKLTGNVKLTVDSGGLLWLNSFDASQELSAARFKKYAINPSSTYQRDLFFFFDEGKLPTQLVYQVYEKDNQYLNTKRSYDEQYDNFYNYGVEQLNSKFYEEDYTFLAPLWMRKNLPDFFVIFRVDHPLSKLSYQNATNEERFSEFFQNAQIVKSFDMRETSPLGTYLRKLVNDPRFNERPLEVSFDPDVQTTWFGINYSTGNLTGKGEFLYDFWNTDARILDFEETITNGFERNGIISTNLINLEFLFNDEEATPYTINRYFGFYVTENQLAEFEIVPELLGAIPGQTPTPKTGVDGQPYNMQPFVQTNQDGVILPVEYYHNPSDGTINTSATPEYVGLTKGKFPLPSMVDDPLRIFYVKDRFGKLKRVNQLSEKNFGNPGSPSFKRATQLRLFDTQENISDYGGLTQLSSQPNAELLDGGNAQLVIYLEDLQQDGRPIADYETLEFYMQKLNTEERNFYYRLEVTGVTGTVVEFDIQKNDTGSFTALPNDYLTTIEVDTANPDDYGYVDSYLTFLMDGGVPSVGDSWEVGVSSGNIVYANSVVGSAPPSLTFYGEAEYPQFKWILEANPVGLSPGEAWDYPVYDPRARNYKNTFCNRGTPAQVAIALAECLNNFNPKIVDAKAIGNAVYMKARPNWEDGNKILFKRNLKKNISVPKNLGFYQKGNVDRGEFTYELYATPTPSTLNLQFDIKESTQVYEDRYFYIKGTALSGGQWVVDVRKDVDPANPLVTGYLQSYVTPVGSTLLKTPDFTVDLAGNGSFTGIYRMTWGLDAIQQYFVGGVKRKRARAKVAIIDGQRYYQDRQTEFTATVAAGSTVLSSVTYPNLLYVGAPISGAGIPLGSKIVALNEYLGEISISAAATESASITAKGGDLTAVNTEQIYQQWFQVQKGNYSRLRGWSVQGKYAYSLPFLENTDFSAYDEYSIIQIDRDRDEFYYTQDRKIVAYQVYRPIFGIFTALPIKAFDVDTYFSDYSYAPTLEMLRYFNREETGIYEYDSTNQTGYAISETLSLNMNENYDLCVILEKGAVPDNETVDVEAYIEFFDANDSTWKLVDTIVSRVYLQNPPPISVNADQAASLKTVMFNTCYPPYFYDTLEVPNDYIEGTANPGPYNVTNAEPSPREDQNNRGPQYTAAGTRNYVRKKLYTNGTDECKFTRARISRIIIWSDYSTQTHHSFDFSYKVRVQGSNYYRDTNIGSFQGFSSLADFLNNEDLQQIEIYKQEQSFEKFTYQMLFSEYDRLRENQQKDLAVKSKVVPSILKWVQEGTDARDNYYRLNNSTAFGITNFSPDPQVDFTEPLLLTHEFPYLDVVPKDYPLESLEGTRSYFFQKLSDIAHNGKSWYELLTTDASNDWFLKYFAIGSPTELSQDNTVVPKSREERYTFFKYIEGLDLSQTLFRGAKINVIDYDTTVTPKTPINESQRFSLYKFAAIARFVPHENFGEEKPLQIEVVNNEVHKTILVIITIFVQDYRLQAGLGDYSFFYYAIDQLRNSMQTQAIGGWGSKTNFFKRSAPAFTIDTPDMKYPMEMPYCLVDPDLPELSFSNFLDASNYFYSTSNPWSPLAEDVPKAFSIMRPRQLLLGGGRLELDDVKLGGKAWIVGETDPANNIVQMIFQPLNTPTDGTAQFPFVDQNTGFFPISKEIFPINDNYRTSIDYFLGGWEAGTVNSFTGTVTAGSNVITSVSSTSDVFVGAYLIGTGIPPNTYVEIINIAGNSVTVNNVATASGAAQTFTFYINYGYPIFENMPDSADFPFQRTPMTADGTLSELGVSTKRGNLAKLSFTIYDALQITEDIRLDYVTLSSADRFSYFSALPGVSKASALVNSSTTYQTIPTLPTYPPYVFFTAPLNFKPAPSYDVYQSFNLRGGTQFYQERKRLISFASIFKMFNERSEYILHRKITAAGSAIQSVPDFELQFVTFDTIKKLSRAFYKDDEDKPLEYQNTEFIGFDSLLTKEQEYEFRHRGLYEPKMLEIVSFWVREDQAFTDHFQKDFLLKNTHINGSSSIAGLLRNYSYNKVADSEVLKIARTSSYKSLYPLIGEVAIDKRDMFAINSSWDSAFYRKYSSTIEYSEIAGTEEMKETKVFLASKAMKIPKTFDLHQFLPGEVDFVVIQPKKSIGVTSLDSPDTAESNSLETKPLLSIKVNLQERLKRALLEGILENTSFDEFAWFNALGITEITYTPEELQTLKIQYIEKNLLPLYEVESISFYSNKKEGLPVMNTLLTEAEKLAAGYRIDNNVNSVKTNEFKYELQRLLDTKSANAFSISAVLKRI